MSQSSAPDPELWARLEKWMFKSGNTVRFNTGIGKPGFYIYTHDMESVHGRTFNAALRKFLKGVRA